MEMRYRSFLRRSVKALEAAEEAALAEEEASISASRTEFKSFHMPESSGRGREERGGGEKRRLYLVKERECERQGEGFDED